MAEPRKDRQQQQGCDAVVAGLITLEDVVSLSAADLVSVVSGPGLQAQSGCTKSPGGAVASAPGVQELLERFDK